MERNEILEQAKALGKQLASHPKVKQYLEAQERLQRDEGARRLLRDYQLLAEKLQRQQAEGKQPSREDAERLARLEADLASNEAVKAWLGAQTDYLDLMYRVDRAIEAGLAEALGGRPARPQPTAPPVPPAGPAISAGPSGQMPQA